MILFSCTLLQLQKQKSNNWKFRKLFCKERREKVYENSKISCKNIRGIGKFCKLFREKRSENVYENFKNSFLKPDSTIQLINLL